MLTTLTTTTRRFITLDGAMEEHTPLSGEIERIAGEVYETAFKVHRNLGPGLLESAYEACQCHDLGKAGISFERQVSLPVEYDGVKIDAGL